MYLSKKTLIGIIIFLTLYLIWITGLPLRYYKIFTNANGIMNSSSILSPDEAKHNELKNTYNQIIKYEMNSDYAALYGFLTPSEKAKLTLSDYIQQRSDTKNAYNLQYSVDNVEVNGDVGIITRTLSYCKIEGCSDSERTVNTLKKKYEYITGKWYHELEDTLYCERQKPYAIPQEFERGFSLIIQRLGQSNDPVAHKNAQRFSGIKNCLDIQYANSDDEMSGAEGVFMFSKDSSPEKLQVFVSPRYQAKDDLLTAILLSHEISHALIFALGSQDSVPCYKNESIAYREQMRFLSTLNQEEIASITYRYNNRSSEEAVSVINLIVGLNNTYGATPEDKALNYVKNSTFYQKQCGDK